jgi:hypothetical protein
VAPPDSFRERLGLREFDPAHNLVIEDDFMAVHPLGENEITVQTDSEYYKPLYKNINLLNAASLAVNYIEGETGITQKGMAGNSMVFGKSTIRKSDLTLKTECRIIGSAYKFKIINETENFLDDCVIFTAQGCHYLGDLNGGLVKEITLTADKFISVNGFIVNYPAGDDKPARYKNRLLKVWLNRHNQLADPPERPDVTSGRAGIGQTGYLVGWNTVRGKYDTGTHPELWIIPFKSVTPSK